MIKHAFQCTNSYILFIIVLFFSLQRMQTERLSKKAWNQDGITLAGKWYVSLYLASIDVSNAAEECLWVFLIHVPSLQDVADFEWVMWFSTFRNHILFALVGHVIFAKIFTLVASKVRACVFRAKGGWPWMFARLHFVWASYRCSCTCLLFVCSAVCSYCTCRQSGVCVFVNELKPCSHQDHSSDVIGWR